MGVSQSSSIEKKRSLLSEQELSYADHLFNYLADNKSNYITYESFKAKFSNVVNDDFKSNLFKYLFNETLSLNKNEKKQCSFSRDAFFAAFELISHGFLNEKSKIFLALCQSNEQSLNTIEIDDISKLMRLLCRFYLQTIINSDVYKLWNFDNVSIDDESTKLTEYLTFDLLKTYGKDFSNKNQQIDVISIDKWLCNQGSFVLDILSIAIRSLFELTLPSHIACSFSIATPLKYHKDSSTILDLTSLVILSYKLLGHQSFTDNDEKNVKSYSWRLLYNNIKHGDSFINMLKSITDEGPLVVLIKEKGSGYIFGGYCSFNVSPNPNFFGDDRCFIFSLHPQFRLYDPTGYDQNFVYFNAFQNTFPNGLGFGGRLTVDDRPVHFFSLWMDEDFGKGISRGGCCTYNSPKLSLEEHFQIDVVEIWGIGCYSNIYKRRDSKSVLDKNPELKAILAMTGKGPLSEGLREEDETSDTPENRKI